MKRILCIARLFALFFALSAHAAGKEKHLFILSGQSNMYRLDPEVSFTPTLEAEFGAENVTVVKDAKTSQPIRRWYKKWKPATGDKPKATGELFDRLMEKVKEAMEGKAFATVTFVWMQGERDAKESHGDVYAKSLEGLIKQLKTDLGRNDLNVVIGRLSDYDLENKKYPHWTMVREAQMNIAEANARGVWVNTDDLNDGFNKKGKVIKDDLHMSVEGYKSLGQRFADQSIALIKKAGTQDVVTEGTIIRLWPIDQVGGEQNRLKEDSEVRGGGKTTYRNINDPNLTIYPAQSSKPAPAVVYCPGGAYSII